MNISYGETLGGPFRFSFRFKTAPFYMLEYEPILMDCQKLCYTVRTFFTGSSANVQRPTHTSSTTYEFKFKLRFEIEAIGCTVHCINRLLQTRGMNVEFV